MYSFELSPEKKEYQEAARKFAEKEVRPLNGSFDDDWNTHVHMAEVLKKAAALGFMGLPIDPKYGGSGADGMTIMAVLEELAAVNGGVACVIGDTWFAQTPIVIAANEEQRERFLRPLSSREKANLGCICMTEPASGADIEDPRMKLRTVKTIVREAGDEYIINGVKQCRHSLPLCGHRNDRSTKGGGRIVYSRSRRWDAGPLLREDRTEDGNARRPEPRGYL